MPFRKFLLTLTALFSAAAIHAQVIDTTSSSEGEMDQLLEDHSKPKKEYVTATFKATRVINGQSNENLGAGILDFIILHRFGRLNQGVSDFFGLDNANTRIGFDYGITNWLMVGVGRSSYQKEYDGFLKVKILRQTTDNSMPITLSYAGTIMTRSDKVELADTTAKYYFSNRVSYANQVIIARKFNNRFSFQLTPSHVHYNLVKASADPNDVFALGVGGRVKLSRRIAITGEWFYTLEGAKLNGYRNSLSLGMDIETGGHVFQLHFSNSTGMTERTFIGQTSDDWGAGGIHFGFNLSRVFTIVKPKEFR
jgi:hypothetical protein